MSDKELKHRFEVLVLGQQIEECRAASKIMISADLNGGNKKEKILEMSSEMQKCYF